MAVSLALSRGQREPSAATPVGGGVPTKGRSLGHIAWRRLRRDRVAMGGIVEFFRFVPVSTGSRKRNTSRRPLYTAQLVLKVMNRGCCGQPLRLTQPCRSRAPQMHPLPMKEGVSRVAA